MEKLIRDSSEPLEPIPTNQQPLLRKFEGIRCLAFDVYGTLLISERQCAESAMAALLKKHQLPRPERSLLELIRRDHLRANRDGTEFPEVEIRELWAELHPTANHERLALDYEMLAHRVWPMPGLELPKNMEMALVSNAQFYTPLILRALTTITINPDLCFFSYQYRQAKPGTFLFDELKKALATRNIRPSEVLYIGNDHQKDIVPARAVGFRTVLFGGDARSLSYHPDLPAPDAIITHLSQLPSLYGVSSLKN